MHVIEMRLEPNYMIFIYDKKKCGLRSSGFSKKSFVIIFIQNFRSNKPIFSFIQYGKTETTCKHWNFDSKDSVFQIHVPTIPHNDKYVHRM